jgi:hypothetical protein
MLPNGIFRNASTHIFSLWCSPSRVARMAEIFFNAIILYSSGMGESMTASSTGLLETSNSFNFRSFSSNCCWSSMSSAL